ncbi:uncharacterized protein LOC123312209 isoform X2 [Coccinella septempunctata]|nr:uncharacterized protein LOC123312209 isoform X2 [Coccinella septempunctata]
MLHITEDTPADMLSGAMDLSIHLPTGKTVKMCVERRTPMMDLLVQVTTNHQLQITNYTLQPLQTSSSDNYSEKVLSYYPNTPIGALDTQHIKVIPKTRTLPITKNALPVTQPFETTFRLKVHLPRNQLYVTRVSKHVHIEDIMRKVCEEKSLDPNKYEVRHPGNLDEILDPKLTLHDYMITEINLVVKGSNRNSQIFTSDDIMTLKKEEERKVTSNKSGGGVFNLLFRRGKSNNTPTTTPPANKEPPPSTLHREDPPTKPTPQTVAKSEPQKEKPKVPQRKRRPAPKPPQPVEKPPQEEPVQLRNGSVISDSSNVSENGAKHGSGVTICHSRHSSDSSGYHETSILSDQCNTSLPRRNRMGEGAETMGRLKLNRYSESTGNLTKMTSQSRSTSSLIFPGRKKKAAPPPPKPLQTPSSSTTNLESPVVASQTPLSSSSSKTDLSLASQGTQKTTNPPPIPRRRKGPVPTPSNSLKIDGEDDRDTTSSQHAEESLYSCPYQTEGGPNTRDTPENSRPPSNMSTIDILKSLEYLNLDDQGNEIKPPEVIAVLPKSKQAEEETHNEDPALIKRPFILNLVDKNLDDDNASVATESPVKNETTSIISDVSSVDIPPRKQIFHKEMSVSSVKSSESALFEEGRMRRWGSWEKLNFSSVTPSPIHEMPRYSTSEDNLGNRSIPNAKDVKKRLSKEYSSQTMKEINTNLNEESEGREDVKNTTEEQMIIKDPVSECLKQMDGNKRVEEGVFSNTDVSSTTNHPPHKTFNSDGKSCNNSQIVSPLEEKEVCISENLYTTDIINEISLDDVERYKNYGNSPDSGNSSEISEKSKIDDELNNPEILEALVAEDEVIEEWQLPSPPKAFKDTFPNSQLKETSETDSVITPELIEKLERIEKEQAVHNEQNRKNSVSDDLYADNELILNKLSLENLEKRKSLVYNRELATSLKLSYESEALKKVATDSSKPDSSKTLDKSDKTQEEIRQAVKKEEATTESKHSTLPNFKITTYEEPKQIKVFEDDTIRSNSDFSGKSLSLNRGRTLDKTGFGRSMENISVRKNESDDVFKRPKDAEHRTFRPISEHYRRPVNRSGSFSAEHNEWSSSRPVARSKSQVALRRGERKNVGFESSNMSKSSSLFDVSGLQSLEVMKKIQNKLNTPTTSMETLSKAVSEKIEAKPKAAEVQEPPKRKYQYTGPPSINMGTWSERPKVPVSVKEDADYKLGQGTNNRYLNTTVQNGSRIIDVKEQKFVGEIASKQAETQTVTITCNGSSERKDFNVLIKIEDQNRRFQDQKVDSMYKTSYSLNRNSQRPHSVAFPSDFDISRVPVVRSVELKKTFRDIPGNTSVIQLNQSNDNYHPNSFSERYTTNTTSKDVSKPVMRAKSFLQGAPVVRGFRTLDNNTISTNNTEVKVENSNRYSWQPTTSMTLPSAPKKDTFTTNQNVPFSRFNLRRTESKNSRDDDWGVQDRTQTLPSFSKPHFEPHQNGNLVNTNSKPEIPKPPPQMPKTIQKKITQRQFVPVLDPRDELLKSIRDFGGKKGLRSRKA